VLLRIVKEAEISQNEIMQVKQFSKQARSVQSWTTLLQDSICSELTHLTADTFKQTNWNRKGGGGGSSRIIQNATHIERGGVNISAIHGDVNKDQNSLLLDMMKSKQLISTTQHEGQFFACGLSLVIHPRNPFVPTTHANYRYFECQLKDQPLIWWFGGGADLTPYYINKDQCAHFHAVHQAATVLSGKNQYSSYKKNCDDYFYLPHRKEHRGVGGIFFDYLNKPSFEDCFSMVKQCGQQFTAAYGPILKDNKDLLYTKEQLAWQHMRRSRYVEFNLLYDRGTLFGLKTNGRIESIFMSLPPTCGWNEEFVVGDLEQELIDIVKHPMEWVK
tara:strand:+ start:988 stop:1980 length:993 start_codon:yes stop_codon:yes gene_type:complete